MFCNQCGKGIAVGAKFCVHCGVPLNLKEHTKPEEQRKIVYDGAVHKCLNCGEVLKSFMVNCPACGHEIRGTNAVSAIRELSMFFFTLYDSNGAYLERSGYNLHHYSDCRAVSGGVYFI